VCRDCWDEEGSPAIDTPGVRLAASAVRELFVWCPVGGALHIVVDDWNVEDHHLTWCLAPEQMTQYGADEPEGRAAEHFAGLALLPLTEEERLSALALEEGFWSPP
jgi:hypothetical protein